MARSAEADATRGHRKKARTRSQLLAAGWRALESKGDALTARDVTDAADMSTGTFYNYFVDTDDLVDEITRQQLLDIAAEDTLGSMEDPALRIAVTATQILRRALVDPVWGTLVLRLVYRAHQPNRMNGHLRDDIVEGYESGRFARDADDATLDQAMGLLVMTIRRFVAGDDRPGLVPAMVARLLETLGISSDEAERLAADAAAH